MEKPTLLSIDTPLLRVGCEISGPEGGAPVLLLHGWPDSARTWDRVLPALHGAGLQTIVPHLRGCGPTLFHDAATMRSGQLTALAEDALALAEALGLKQFAVVGHDWGARAAYVASCLRPDIVTRSVALSVGYGTNDPSQTLALRQIQNYWYHWYLSLDRGEALLRDERRAFTRYIWSIWNPAWEIAEEEYDATAEAFENPDWAAVVLHGYRVRWGLVAGDPRYNVAEARLREAPEISVPTLVIHGGSDPCNDPTTSQAKERLFSGRYERVVLEGVGHFPQREAAERVAAALVKFLAEG